jgi:2-dehydropantoate 2-reductase
MDKTKTHYGILGMGSIGTVFSVLLKQAGHRVSVLERVGSRVDYIRDHRLKLSGELPGEAGPFESYTEPKDLIRQKPDVVLVCTKSCDSRPLLNEIRGCEPKDATIFVSCQNGLDVEEQITEIFGANRGLRMVLNLGCAPVSENETQVSFSFVHYLSWKNNVGSIAHKIHDDFNGAGLKTKLTKEYQTEAFKKAILNSAMGGVCAVAGMRMKEAMEHPEISWMIKEIIREAITVAQAMNLGIPTEYFDEAVAYLAKGGNHKPSMLMDIERKQKTENEYHCGRIHALAKEFGVKVPVIQTIYYLIRRLESQAQ